MVAVQGTRSGNGKMENGNYCMLLGFKGGSRGINLIETPQTSSA